MNKQFIYANSNNPKGTFKWLDKKALKIPEDKYQRPASSQKKIANIASNWDWMLAETLTVTPNGSGYNVVNGGHRLRAANLIPTIKKLPCMVFSDGNDTRDATAFVGQCKRTNVTPYHKHRAMVKANDPVAVEIDAMITDAGYAPSDRTQDSGFKAITALYRFYEIDKEEAQESLSVCAEVMHPDPIRLNLLKGVFWAGLRHKQQNNGKTLWTDGNIEKLVCEGAVGHLREVNRLRMKSGLSAEGGDHAHLIYARAIINLLNKGRGPGKIKVAI